MTETTGPISPPPNRVAFGERISAARSDLSSTSVGSTTQPASNVAPDTRQAADILGTATAQLSALRNQADVAAANGDVATLRQLAQQAVAVGVAAGASAESLAGDITATLAIAQRRQPETSGSAAANPAGAKPTSGPSALGLDPAVIAQLFNPPSTMPADPTDTAPAPQPSSAPPGGLAGSLDMITSLNSRAGAIITQARSLLAAMNTAIGQTAGPGGVDAGTATENSPGAFALNGLAGLLDQAESSMSARIFAATQQVGGGSAAPTAIAATEALAGITAPALDLEA